MNRGFTLIETLVYLALFALMVGGIVACAYVLFASSDRNQTVAMLEEEKNFITSKIQWILGSAHTIQSPSAGSSGLMLVAELFDGTERTIGLADGNIELDGTSLNNSNTIIENLIFIHSNTGNAERIEAGFRITAKTGGGAGVTRIASTTWYVPQ